VSGPARTTLLAALAVLLTATSLFRVYDDGGFAYPVLGAVLAVAAAGLLLRRLRVPALLQPVVAVVAVGLYLALLHARDTLALGLLPTLDTARRLGTLLGEGLADVETTSAPVPTTPGLVLLAVVGAAAVAIAVDLIAVALRRPAVAGLPLLALLVVPSGTLEGGVGWWPFALGAAGWLLLLVDDAGSRVTRWGTALRSQAPRGAFEDSSLGRVGRRIGVTALGVAIVVPALVPGLESRLLQSTGGSGLGGSRTTVTYNPITELGGQLRLPEPRPLLAYRTTDPTPDYLRLTTLDRFDDSSGWSSSELSADLRRDAVTGGIPVPSAVRAARTAQIQAAVQVQDLGGPWLPVPAVPSGVEIDGPWLWDSTSETVFSTRVDLRDVRDTYVVTANRVVVDPASLRRGGALPGDVQPLAEPPEVSPYVRELTEQVIAGAENGYDIATALQALFRTPSNGFEYSEDTSVPGIDAPDALEAFLRGRRGFCEQYASAMAAMARVAGLPARVAVGFTPGTAQDGDTWQVTTSDAHAWPEIWFSGAGWVRFEPTPRAEQVTTPDYTVPPVEGQEEQPVLPEQPAQPEQLPQDQAPAAQDPRLLEDGGLADGADEGGTVVTGRRLGLTALLLGVLAAPALLAGVRRRRAWRDPGPATAWALVVDDAVDVGHRWNPADSPRAAADRLLAQRPLPGDAAAALRDLAVQVEEVRYARPGSAGPVEAAELREEVALVRSGLLATAPPRARWLARLLPASAMRWASTTAGGAAADGLDRVDDLVAAVGRRLPGRRRPA
jgi:hypothetical protein